MASNKKKSTQPKDASGKFTSKPNPQPASKEDTMPKLPAIPTDKIESFSNDANIVSKSSMMVGGVMLVGGLLLKGLAFVLKKVVTKSEDEAKS